MGTTLPETHAAPLHVQLLSAFRVTVGERVIDEAAWRLRKAASLVKLLALAPGHQRQKEQVVEWLWPELAPAAANNNLRRTLHAARRCLEPGATGSRYLLSQGDQLCLASNVGLYVDVDQFEQAAAHARRTPTPQAYAAALALYTGELLPQDRYEDWAAGRRDALQRLFVALLVEQARLHAGAGERAEAIAACQRLVALEPAHEEAQTLLMRLYALEGQRAQALQQYQLLANALHAELAVAPDAAVQALREAIAEGRFPAEPPPAVAPRPRPRTNLPHALTSFVGREQALSAVQARLGNARLLTLTGPGGSGKTRLALEAARAVAGQYADGVWLADLAPLRDPALVAQVVAHAVGLAEARSSSPEAALAANLSGRHMLLVLDNCEHLAESVARLAASLLQAAPRLSILATSRQPLDVMGEATWPVPPLAVPPTPAAQPQDFEAVRLFVERARLAQWSFTLTPGNAAAVAEICRRLDGMPLAIELAAARLRSLTVAQIASRLDERFSLLTSGNRAALPRHQTLHAAIEWSHQLLPEHERRLFDRLGVFAGGCDLEAIEAVCQPGPEALDGVTSLLDKNLLRREPGLGDELRVGMLETLHAFAREQLAAGGDLAGCRQRHARYYLALAEAAEPELTGPQQTRWLERLALEHDNLRAALAWAVAQPDAEPGLRLAAALWRFWLVRGHYAEGRAYAARVLARAGGQPRTALVAAVLTGAGALAYRQGDNAAAGRWYAEALSIARELADPALEADVLNAAGLMAQAQGDYARARALYGASLALARAIGDQQGQAVTLNNLGVTAIYQVDYAAARPLLLESLSLARSLGNLNAAGNTLNNLGMLAFHQEDYAAARSWYEQRLAVARELGSQYGIASGLHNLGLAASRLGDDATARRLCEESLAISRELGDRTLMAATLVILGTLAAQRGDPAQARALYLECLALAHAVQDRYRIAYVLEEWALLAARQGHAGQAARLGGAAQAMREAISAPQPLSERAAYEQALEAVQAQVGATVWAAAWAEGRAMTTEQVLAYAQGPG